MSTGDGKPTQKGAEGQGWRQLGESRHKHLWLLSQGTKCTATLSDAARTGSLSFLTGLPPREDLSGPCCSTTTHDTCLGFLSVSTQTTRNLRGVSCRYSPQVHTSSPCILATYLNSGIPTLCSFGDCPTTRTHRFLPSERRREK